MDRHTGGKEPPKPMNRPTTSTQLAPSKKLPPPVAPKPKLETNIWVSQRDKIKVETNVGVREQWSAAQAVRLTQAGLLCRGIYLANQIEEIEAETPCRKSSESVLKR